MKLMGRQDVDVDVKNMRDMFRIPLALLVILLSSTAVLATGLISSQGNVSMTGYNITLVPVMNLTSMSGDGTTLTVSLNSSTFELNSTADITLSSPSYNNDLLSLTINGNGGRLNFSNKMNSSSSNYYFKFDGTYVETQITNSTAWLTGNRTISGTHVLTWAPRNVTFTNPSVSPSVAIEFDSIAISTTITDNDGGAIGSAQAEVKKPGGSLQNYSMSCSRALCILSLTDTGVTGIYTVTHFYETDSSGASYSSPSSLTFSIGQMHAGGTGTGPGGSSAISNTLNNISSAATNITNNIPSIKPPSGQVGGMFWWLTLTLGSIMTVLSLSSKKASGNLLFIGLGIAALSAYMLQLIPPIALKLLGS